MAFSNDNHVAGSDILVRTHECWRYRMTTIRRQSIHSHSLLEKKSKYYATFILRRLVFELSVTLNRVVHFLAILFLTTTECGVRCTQDTQ
jgi:hypothetical protein